MSYRNLASARVASMLAEATPGEVGKGRVE